MAVVVIADDDPRLRDVISRVLERAGHTVLAVTDGDAAWERVREARPDLVILDGLMPGVDGFEVCERIRRDPSTADIPVIMVSGWLPMGSGAGRLTGPTLTLGKPFMPDELMARVGEALG